MSQLDFFNASKLACADKVLSATNFKNHRIVFQILDDFCMSVIESISGVDKFYYLNQTVNAESIKNIEKIDAVSEQDILILNEFDVKRLSDLLLSYVDANIQILAPITAHYYLNRPLFLISIPKGGTHLLYRLVEALGYQPAVVHDGDPKPGNWYCVEYSNSHTVAKDFFIDSVRVAPFGNRHHPFPRTPTLYIYRNPLDVVVSEANYYHRDGATVFSSYLRHLSFENRLLRLIDDPHLLGSIRDRINNFIPWFDCENVIPVSFEELIGDKGGGSNDLRDQLIWSIQLKLHIPGSPKALGAKIFDENSPTFNEGRIGSSHEKMSQQALNKFFSLNQDFMKITGYATDAINPNEVNDIWQKINKFSNRISEFRKRPLKTSEEDFADTPFTVTSNFLGYNIVRFNQRYYGVSQSAGPIDLFELRAKNQLDQLISSTNLEDLKSKITLNTVSQLKSFANKEIDYKVVRKQFSIKKIVKKILKL